jgi:hypothetical protein
MKIQAPQNLPSDMSLKATAPSQPPKIDFKSVFEAINRHSNMNLDSGLEHINKIRNSLANSKVIDPRLILQYQIEISQLNLRVEMLSKAADSAGAIVRKVSNAQ